MARRSARRRPLDTRGRAAARRCLLSGGKLSLTHLGRSLNGAAHVKHQLKAVDRLLVNRHLHRERGIYRAIVFGLRYARSNSAARLEMLLLLGALATLVVWLVGLAARALQLNRHLQANTERRRDVLSTFFIGASSLGASTTCPRWSSTSRSSRCDTTYSGPRRHEFVGILQNSLLGALFRSVTSRIGRDAAE